MTDTEFRQQYRLLKLITEDDARSYNALDTAGRAVLVHYLSAASPDTQRLLAAIDALPAATRRVVQRVEVDGAPVLVTEAIPDFQSLSAWLHTLPKTRGPAPAGPSEMTQMFGPSGGPPPQPPVHAPKAPPPRPAIDTEATVRLDAVMERRPVAPQPAPPPPPPPAPAAGGPENKPNIRWRDPSGTDPAGDRPVVRWKKDAEPSLPPVVPPLPANLPPPVPPLRAEPPKRAGELTQLFGPGAGGGGSRAADEPRPAAPPPPPPPPPPPASPLGPGFGAAPPRTEPGEFTRLFNPERAGLAPAPRPERRAPDYLEALRNPGATPASPAPPAATPAPPPQSAPGEFTRMLGAIPAAPPTTPPAAASTPAATSGPGEFTRVIKGVSARPPAGAGAAPAPQPRAADDAPADTDDVEPKSRRLVVLFVALGALGLLAIGLVLYFVLRAG